MPIYEYKCADCDVHLEKRQSVNEDALTVCEKCGGKLEKQWSLSGFQFKGEGWYVTDYAGKTATPATGSETVAEKSSTPESTPTPSPASKETVSEKKADKPAVTKST